MIEILLRGVGIIVFTLYISISNSPRGIGIDSMRLLNENIMMTEDNGQNEEGDLSIPKPLNHVWTVYYNEALENQQSLSYENYFSEDKKIGDFSTVQSFWGIWNTLNAPHYKRPQNYTLKFFKKNLNDNIEDLDIAPSPSTPLSRNNLNHSENTAFEQDNDEYPPLRNGGKWCVYSYDKEKREQMWTELLLACVGEVDYFGRRSFDVMGIVFQSHEKFDSINIWSGNSSISTRTIQKMMKRVAHALTGEQVSALVGEDVFVEFSTSHFGKSYSYNSSKSNSRSGSGYNTPSRSGSGYSSPLFRRDSRAAQYSPRFNHQHFHNKLREKLQQRLGDKLSDIIQSSPTQPSGTSTGASPSSSSSSPAASSTIVQQQPQNDQKMIPELKRAFGEKQRRISLKDGQSQIVDLSSNTKETAATVTTVKRKPARQAKTIDYFIKFFLVFVFAVVLKVSVSDTQYISV
jgi:hypothetical protein